jgi:hypothetical protein
MPNLEKNIPFPKEWGFSRGLLEKQAIVPNGKKEHISRNRRYQRRIFHDLPFLFPLLKLKNFPILGHEKSPPDE